MDMEFQEELRRLQEAAGIKYGAGIYDQIGSTADIKDTEAKPKQQQAGTGVESDAVSEEKDDACNNSDCVTDVDADGYFPETDHGTKVNSAGPAAARAGDNPMQKSMKTKVSEATLNESRPRLIDTQTGPNAVVKTYYNSEWDEYQSKVFINGVHDPEADNFTDDRDDAIATAKHIAGTNQQVSVNEMRKLAGLSEECHYGESVDEDEDTEDEDKDSSEVIKEAYSSFFNMLQDEFKKANLK